VEGCGFPNQTRNRVNGVVGDGERATSLALAAMIVFRRIESRFADVT
jgi:hypothetical protein